THPRSPHGAEPEGHPPESQEDERERQMGSQGEHAVADAVGESDAGAADDAGHREVGLGSTAPVNDLHAASCRGFRSMSGGLHPYPRTSRKDGLSASSLGGPLVQILEDDLC